MYTEGQQLQVKVHAEVVDPKVQVHETTNEFHFTFAAGYDVPPVTPRSYAGACLVRGSVDLGLCLALFRRQRLFAFH